MRVILFFMLLLVNARVDAQDINGALKNRVASCHIRSQSAAKLGNETVVRLRCGKFYDSSMRALYVVDGKIDKLTGDIKPDDVENVRVIQGTEAVALYGEPAKGGAIIITLKKKNKTVLPAERQSVIAEKYRGLCVPQMRPLQYVALVVEDNPASVSVRSKSTAKLGNSTLVRLRCGYVQEYLEGPLYVIDNRFFRSFEDFELKTGEAFDPETVDSITVLNGPYAAAIYGSEGVNGAIIINTKLKTKTLDSVVVTGTNCWKRRRICCSCCRVVVCSKSITPTSGTKINGDKLLLKVYPNPVQRGNMINVSIPATSFANSVVMISDAAGRVVNRTVINKSIQKGTVVIPVDKNWSAGIYYARISGEQQQTSAIPFLVQ